MGLLDSIDPGSLATYQLAAGLLTPGSFGQGLGRGLTNYQQTLAQAQEMKAKQQAMDLQNVQLQQQQRMFALQTPFLEEAVRRMQGASPAGQTPPPMSQSVMFPPDMNAQRASQVQTPQSEPQAVSRGTMFPGVPDDVAFGTIGTGGFSKIPEMISKYNEPTEFVKTLIAAGIDPRSSQGMAAIKANLAKSNYIAPVNARPGAILRDPQTMQPVAFNPHVPEGGTPVFDASGNVVSINPLQGATNVMQAGAAATARGKAQLTPYAGFTASGQPSAVQSVADVLSPNAPTVTPDAQLAAMREALPMKISERAAMKPGPDRDALDREINRDQNALLTAKPFSASTGASSVFASQPAGFVKTAEESAKDAVENYNEVHKFSTVSAPRNIGLLQTIQQLADKTLVGPGASKLQFINGVLNTLHITPGADQAQNYQIMKKNLNMLVGSQRMGAGGGGTDALQALLEASNPNVAEMNSPAAKEAAEELIAYNRMMMAKDKALPNPTTTNTQNYQSAETKFAPFADPRLWQMEHAANDQERMRILSLMPESERSAFMQKAALARKNHLFD